MRLTSRVLVLWLLCMMGSLAARCGDCKRVLTADEALKRAEVLDGQTVCVRGMAVPTSVAKWERGMLIQELKPTPAKRTAKVSGGLGLIGWGPESGLSGQGYDEESFSRLAELPLDPPAPGYILELTVRGVLMWHKNLRSKLPQADVYPPEVEAMRQARYEAELVMLKIVTAKWIKGGKPALR